MRFLLLLSLLPLCWSSLQGQEQIQWQTKQGSSFSLGQAFSDISVQVTLGPSVALPLGDTIQALRQSLDDFGRSIDSSTYQFRGQLLPDIHFHLGVQVQIPLLEWLQIQTGFQYQRRGYQLHSDLDFSDPEFQYDEFFKVRQSLRVHYLEWPFLAELRRPQGNGNWRALAGFSFGFPIAQNSNKITAKISKDLIINGETVEEESYPFQEEEWLLTDQLRSLLSANLGLRWQGAGPWGAQLLAQYSNRLWKQDGRVKNLNLNVGLVYRIR